MPSLLQLPPWTPPEAGKATFEQYPERGGSLISQLPPDAHTAWRAAGPAAQLEATLPALSCFLTGVCFVWICFLTGTTPASLIWMAKRISLPVAMQARQLAEPASSGRCGRGPGLCWCSVLVPRLPAS